MAGGTARLCPENDARILFLRRVEGLAVLTSLLPLIGCKCRIADGLVDHIKHSTERYRWVRAYICDAAVEEVWLPHD